MKTLDFNSIDFKRKNFNERTIFQACFNIYLANSKHTDIDKLCNRLESVFLNLLDKASKKLESNELNSLLETPDRLGRTVAFQASKFSEAIMAKLCDKESQQASP